MKKKKSKIVTKVTQVGIVTGHFSDRDELNRNAINDFDQEIKTITQRRGEIYDHPAVDFSKVARMKKALPDFEDPRVKHIAEMICVKLARLSKSPNHVESWIDVAGYARTGVMLIGK